MIKQIICTIIIILGISTYILFQKEEELSGNTIIIDKQYFEGKKAGEFRRLNTIKWMFNKNYRRGFIWGQNNEEI